MPRLGACCITLSGCGAKWAKVAATFGTGANKEPVQESKLTIEAWDIGTLPWNIGVNLALWSTGVNIVGFQ